VVVSVLGPCVVEDGGQESLSLTQRKILARLAVDAPGAVTAAALEQAVWGDSPPATARAALQNQVSRLRRRLGSDALRTTDDGYALALPTDLVRIAESLRRAEFALAEADHATAYDVADAALGERRGRPLDELDDLLAAEPTRRRLHEVGRALEDVRLEAAIGLRRVRWAVPEAGRLSAEDPFDEHRVALLVRSFAAAGRRGDALAAAEAARRVLARELGLGPGPELRAAEAAVLEVEGNVAGPDRTRLIGREAEVQTILDALDARRSVVVTGEAGLGKTAVLREVERRLRHRGQRAAAATCSAHPASPVTTLRDLLEIVDVVPDDRLPAADWFAEAIRRDLARRGPLVLVVDGIDRAGPTTVLALAAVAEAEEVTLVLTAMTSFDLEPAAVALEEVALAPLDVASVRELATHLGVPAAGEVGDMEWLHRMSGGNPLLLSTLLEDPVVRDHFGGQPGSFDLPPLPHLRDMVRRRLDRVAAPGRGALAIAAVCGPTVPLAVMVELAEPAGIQEAVDAGILVVDPQDDEHLRFRHEAVQRVLADDVPPGHRTELHHRIAALLADSGGSTVSIAIHALAAEELDPEGAHREALRAAEAASGEGAHADAVLWCDRAVAVAGRGRGVPERARVEALVRRGDALRLSGSPDHERALFEAADAAVALSDPRLLGEAAFAALQLGATTESGSMHERAVVLAEHALEVVDDPDRWARIAAAASLMYSMTSRPDRCRELFLAAETRAASPAARRNVLPFAYLALGHPGDLDERSRLTDELLALADEADDSTARFEALQLAVSVGIQRADGDLVRRCVADVAELTPLVGDVGRRWSLAYMQASVAHLDGDLTRAEELSEQALATFLEVSPSRAWATYSAQLLPLRLAANRLSELADHLVALVAEQPGVPAWHAALALCVAQIDTDLARAHAAAALDDVPPDFTWLAAHVIGGRAAAIVGDADLARRYTDRLEPWSGLVCWQGTCAYGPVDTVLALLSAAVGDEIRATALAASARRTATSLGAPVFLDELAHLPAQSPLG
jgi:DNA-binding SARP family transcriptional activator